MLEMQPNHAIFAKSINQVHFSPLQVRKYQQEKQLRTSVSASQAALQQLAEEHEAAELAGSPAHAMPAVHSGPSRSFVSVPAGVAALGGNGGGSSPPGASWHDAQLADGSGIFSSSTRGIFASHAEQPAWPDQGDSPGASSPAPFAHRSTFEPAAQQQQAEPFEEEAVAYHPVPGGAAGERGTACHTIETGSWQAGSKHAAGSGAAPKEAGGSVVVNLRSDRPFMTPSDIEKKQRQQESFKVCGKELQPRIDTCMWAFWLGRGGMHAAWWVWGECVQRQGGRAGIVAGSSCPGSGQQRVCCTVPSID